jgi:pimeloyl-ACP methyl ester carboxylesterase
MTVSATPERDRTLRLQARRTLAWCEWGPEGGIPVIALYGTPGSRLFCPDVEATHTAGVRLISVDRPGYGGSDPDPDLNVLSVADDLAEFQGLLGLQRSAVFGWSAGGPYALGFACKHPGRVTWVGAAASWGPLREVPGVWDSLSAESRELMELAARDPAAALRGVQARTAWYAANPDETLEGQPTEGNPDAVLLRQPVLHDAMLTWFREGARQRTAGFDADWIATYASPWGFRLSDVPPRTVLWWGDADALCAEAHTRYLARELPDARLTVYPGEGHLAPVPHWAEILGALTSIENAPSTGQAERVRVPRGPVAQR